MCVGVRCLTASRSCCRSSCRSMSSLGQGCVSVMRSVFVDAVNDFDSVRCLLFSIVVNTDIFSDAVEPTVKRGVPSERLDGTKRFYPCFLCEVLRGFGIFDTPQDVGIDAVLIFSHQGVKGFSVAVLSARDELVFVEVRQSCVSFYFSQGVGSSFRVLCCPAFSRVTCLAWMSITVVPAPSVSPRVTMYVVLPRVVWRIACAPVIPSVGMIVPSKRKGSLGGAGRHPSGRNRLLSMRVR